MDGPCRAVLEELSKQEGLRVAAQEPLSRHTSFGVGGPADIYIEPATPQALAAALRLLHHSGIPYIVIGKGTNLLVTDAGVRGAVISLYPSMAQVHFSGRRCRAQAGSTLGKVCHMAADAGLSGMEFTAGIPGTVGGALIMNAGANGGCVADVVVSVTVLDAQINLHTLTKDELSWYYRDSDLRRRGLCVVQAEFELTPSSPAAVHREVYQMLQRRCERHPLGHRSAGSIFKRPSRDYPGRLLELAGAKGLRVGGAEISTKHANFIINTGSATATDVLKLIRRAREMVHDKFGVWLETEVCIIGQLPDELADDPFLRQAVTPFCATAEQHSQD